MSSLIIEVCKVEEVQKHPNADRLDLVRIKGWYCIVGRDNYKVGDLVVFCPVDSLIPEALVIKHNLTYLKNGNRVRTTRLRGVISQGLILDNEDNDKEGTDVASKLGITKWEAPDKLYTTGDKRQVRKRHTNQNFSKYTEIENIKNFNNVFKEGDKVVITEKIHGANWRFGHLKRTPREHWFFNLYDRIKIKLFGEYEHVYGSHNVQLKWSSYGGPKEGFYETNIYGKVCEKYQLKKYTDKDYIIYGEVYGPSVQKLSYGLKDDNVDLVVFDIKYKGKYLSSPEFVGYCIAHDLPTAPTLFVGEYNDKLIEKYINGDSILAEHHGIKQIREGIVIKSLEEEQSPLIGRKVLKCINPDYEILRDENKV